MPLRRRRGGKASSPPGITATVWLAVVSALAQHFSTDQLRFILAHEMAHVRRMDNLVLIVQRLAEMLLFFHPVVWLCGWAMRREAEAACDDAVIRVYGRAAEYAESLTRVAETRTGLTRRLLVNTFAAAESNLASRVRRILKGKRRATLGLTALSVAALVVIACFGLPTAADRSGQHKKDKPTAVAEEKEQEKMDVTTLKYGLRHDPMKFVEEDTSVPAALVRAQVVGESRPGDDAVLEEYVDEILAKQRPDGSFGDGSGDTGR